MEKDLSLLGHKLKLLRDIELNFALDWEGDRYGMDELDSLTAVMNANCKANIKFLAAEKESRHYHCTLVFENRLDICLKKPSQIGWWDLLEEFEVFEIVKVDVEGLDRWFEKTYGPGRDMKGRSGRWEEIKEDVTRVLEGSLGSKKCGCGDRHYEYDSYESI